jgi:hypothetical protein
MKIYQVWMHGFPIHDHDHLLYWDQAIDSYRWYKSLGYKDVKIIDTTIKE